MSHLFSLSAPEPSERSERPAPEGHKKVGGEGRGEVGVFSSAFPTEPLEDAG